MDATGPDPEPAPTTFTVDATAPETTIASGPPAPLQRPDARVRLHELGSRRLRVSTAPVSSPSFADCSSPTGFGPLPDGDYVFEVRAVDLAGNTDASPAGRRFQHRHHPAADRDHRRAERHHRRHRRLPLLRPRRHRRLLPSRRRRLAAVRVASGLFGAESRRTHRSRSPPSTPPATPIPPRPITPGRSSSRASSSPPPSSRPSLSPGSSFRFAGRSPSFASAPSPAGAPFCSRASTPSPAAPSRSAHARASGRAGSVAGSAPSRASARSPTPAATGSGRPSPRRARRLAKQPPDAAARAAPDLHRSRRPLPLGDLRAHPQALTARPRETPGLAQKPFLNTLVTKERRSSLRVSPLEDWSKQAWLGHAPPSSCQSASSAPHRRLRRWGS